MSAIISPPREKGVEALRCEECKTTPSPYVDPDKEDEGEYCWYMRCKNCGKTTDYTPDRYHAILAWNWLQIRDFMARSIDGYASKEYRENF